MTRRRPGPDHALYRHSPLPERPKLRWPGDARVALCVFLYFETWDIDPPQGTIHDRRHDGALGGLFPNYKVHAQFEYGNRVGIFRVLDLLDRHRLPVTVAANAEACEKYPFLVAEFARRGYEFAAHGASATQMLSSQMDEAAELAAIQSCVERVARATGRHPLGWIGQDYGESTRTPNLLSRAGLSYVADWGNDDQPYAMRIDPPLLSIPNQAEWDDVQLMAHRRLSPGVWRDSVREAFDCLHQDGAASGRFFGLHLHPWLIGMPHRIGYLEAVLHHIMPAPAVWRATASEVANYLRELQQATA